jgi:hypothetical protein
MNTNIDVPKKKKVSIKDATPKPNINIVDYKAEKQPPVQNVDILSNQHMIMRLRVADDDTTDDITKYCSSSKKKITKTEPEVLSLNKSVVCNECKMCFWCCHKYDTETVRLPLKVVDNKVYGIGSFCSFECTTSFNFHSKEIMHDVWKSYELINLVAKRNGHKIPICQARTRFSLKTFGGYLDINTFRADAEPSISMPHPIIPISHFIEDGYVSDSKNTKSYIPLDNDRVLKAKQNLMNYDKSTRKSGIHSKMNLSSTAFM